MWIGSNSILSKKLTVNVLQQASWVICPSGLDCSITYITAWGLFTTPHIQEIMP
jgi:hypothetical protein